MMLNLKNLNEKYNLHITGLAHFGAHLGQEVNSYIDLNIENIHLFEPQRSIYKKLKEKKSKLKNVYFYNYGLGSKNEKKEIFKSQGNESASASLLSPEKHTDYYPEIKFIEKELVNIIKFDDLNLEQVNFLNIDIQGYELEALKGSEYSLKNNIHYILIEINRKPLYKNSVLIDELDNYLESWGFMRVETRWASSNIPWGEAFYLHSIKVSLPKKLLFRVQKFVERFEIYYFPIDLYRSLNSWKYNFKQKIKKIIY